MFWKATAIWSLGVREILEVLAGRAGDGEKVVTVRALEDVFRERLALGVGVQERCVCSSIPDQQKPLLSEDELASVTGLDLRRGVIVAFTRVIEAETWEEAWSDFQSSRAQQDGGVCIFVRGVLAYTSEVHNNLFEWHYKNSVLAGFFCKPRGDKKQTWDFYERQSALISGAFVFTDDESELYVDAHHALPEGIKALIWDHNEDISDIVQGGISIGLPYGGGKSSARFMMRIDAKRGLFSSDPAVGKRH